MAAALAPDAVEGGGNQQSLRFSGCLMVELSEHRLAMIELLFYPDKWKYIHHAEKQRDSKGK